MTATRIAALSPVLAYDSRGTPTVSCEVELSGGARASAIVPCGASTGAYEAVELRDGGREYAGRGVDRAIATVRTEIADAVVGMDVGDLSDLAALDRTLSELDGTPSLGRLGANSVLSVSIGAALASAAQHRVEPYVWFADGSDLVLPMPMVNIFSGGAHAATGLDVQDLLVLPIGASSLTEAMHWCWQVRHEAGALIGARGLDSQLVADEGGFGVPFQSTPEALQLLTNAIEAAGLEAGVDAGIAIDVAASQFWNGTTYNLSAENRDLEPSAFLDEVASWCSRFPILSVEDVLIEDDWPGWRSASERLREVQLIGDDLFVTSTDRLRKGIAERTASAVLVKPNQCGTLTLAHDVVTTARAHGYATVLSARSGDTEDSWLADLAVGWSTGQIKVGSMTRSERTAKWNRLLRIEDRLGPDASFAGASCLRRTCDVQVPA